MVTENIEQADRVIHFGEYLRWHRVSAGQTTDEMAKAVGLTTRRWIAIEAMAVPDVQPSTLGAVAKAIGMTISDLDRAWRTTAVPVTRRKAGPTTDVARRFAAACRAAGVTPNEGLRRARHWLVQQPKAVQLAAVGFVPSVPEFDDDFTNVRPAADALPKFTSVVDHLQDPAAVRRRRADAKRRRARQDAPTPTPD